MAKILLIQTSMTEHSKRGSVSNKALHIWKKAYQEINPNDQIIILNLNTDPIGQEVLTSENFETFFNISNKYIDVLKEVNKVVVSTPMTNFNYPAPLKNYLDHILIAGKTFKYKYDGKGESEGLLKHLKVLLITTQGAPKGWYTFGDHTISLTGTWKFMGTDVVKPVIIAGTKTKEFMAISIDQILKKYEKEILESAENF